MSADVDRNGLRAQSWFKPALQDIKKIRFEGGKDNTVFFEKVKLLIEKFVKCTNGEQKSELKYVFIANMLMARIRAAFQNRIDDGVDASTACNELVSAFESIDVDDGTNAAIEKINSVVDSYSEKQEEDGKQSGGIQAQQLDSNGDSDELDDVNSKFSDSHMAIAQELQKALDNINELEGCIAVVKVSDAASADVSGISYAETHIDDAIKRLKVYTAKIDINKKINQAMQGGNKTSQKVKLLPVDPGLVKPDRDYELALAGTGDHSSYIDTLNRNIRKFDTAIIAGMTVTALPLIEKKHSLLKILERLTNPVMKFIRYIFGQIKDFFFKQYAKKFFSDISAKLMQNEHIQKLFGSNTLFSTFKTWFSKIYDSISNLIKQFGNIKDRLKAALGYFLEKIGNFMKQLGRIFKLMWRALRKLWDGIKKIFSKVVSGIIKSIKVMLHGLYKGIKAILRGAWALARLIGRFIAFALRKLRDGLRALGRFIAGKFPGLAKFAENIGKFVKNALDKCKNMFKNAADKLKNCFKKVGDFLKKIKDKIVKAIKKVVQKIIDAIKKAISKAIEVVKKIVVKIVTKIAQAVKGFVIKILKKIGIDIMKKRAKKMAARFGIKFLIKWFTKFLVKFIAKLGIKIAASTAVNCIPILGQIISACMLIYTIIDTILSVLEIYKLFKENPELWDVVKDQVAQWVEKATKFIQGLIAAGAKFFKYIFVDGPKKIGHWIGDNLCKSNKIMNATKEAQLNELDHFLDGHAEYYLQLGLHDRLIFFRDYIDDNMADAMRFSNIVRNMTTDIDDEDDSWYRDTDKITEWMRKRHRIYLKLMNLLANMGIYITSDYYNIDMLGHIHLKIKEARGLVKYQLTAIHGKLVYEFGKYFYENFEELKKEYNRIGDEQRNLDAKKKALSGKFAELKDVAVKKLHFAA